ncbi:MAG TPA: F0F1 ATP synthase subunit delta [Candidatus Saccharimonadales bacterium]|nr:F0F1 ATP synthase subunit delta [Candidatus Saccharimonadales bacterium]
MKASRRRIAGYIADRTLDGTFNARQATELAAYLLEERRTGELASIVRDVQRAWAERGTVVVTATVAHSLSADARREIEARVRRVYPTAKRVIVAEQVDTSLVGGVQLEFIDRRIDASIAGELTKFKLLAVHGKGL